MINRICDKCIHYDVCLLHDDNFIDDVAKNGFCGKFRDKNDLVEVVRCKDCKFRGTDDCSNSYYLECEGAYVDPMEDDDFCSYGERSDT